MRTPKGTCLGALAVAALIVGVFMFQLWAITPDDGADRNVPGSSTAGRSSISEAP
jgi:hypothetical protein